MSLTGEACGGAPAETRRKDIVRSDRALKPHPGLRGTTCECSLFRRRKAVRFCPSTCRCHGIGHPHCPDAEPCLGGCGRKTTPSQTNMPGYCPHCAGDARWIKVA